jgi:hypothetical protein
MAEGERFDLKAGASGARQRVEVAVIDRAGLSERRSWKIAVKAPPPLRRSRSARRAPSSLRAKSWSSPRARTRPSPSRSRVGIAPRCNMCGSWMGRSRRRGAGGPTRPLPRQAAPRSCGSSYPAARVLPWSTSGGSGSIRPTALRRSSLHSRRAAACGACESSCECRGQGFALLSAPRMQRGLRTSARSGGAEAVSKDQALDEGREGGFRGCRCYTGPTFAAHTNPKTPPLSGVARCSRALEAGRWHACNPAPHRRLRARRHR